MQVFEKTPGNVEVGLSPWDVIGGDEIYISGC